MFLKLFAMAFNESTACLRLLAKLFNDNTVCYEILTIAFTESTGFLMFSKLMAITLNENTGV